MIDMVENSPRIVFCPQRTDPPITTPLSPPVPILYDGLCVADMSVTESVSNIRAFMHSSSRITAARNLRGKEAQGFIDLIDKVISTWLQRNGVKGTEHGCRPLHCQNWMEIFGSNACFCSTRFAKPPNYCPLRISYDKSSYPSVKFSAAVGLRTLAKENTWDVAWPSNISGSGQEKRSARFSRCFSRDLPSSLPLLSWRIAILSRNYRLEASVSPQHLAFVGCFCVHGPPEFPYHLRLDAEWECNGIR